MKDTEVISDLKITDELSFIERQKILYRNRKEIIISKLPTPNRLSRDALSELGREGTVFIPVAPFTYRRIELCSRQQIMKQARRCDSSMKTQYFNKLLPIKKYLKQEELEELYFGGLFNEE